MWINRLLSSILLLFPLTSPLPGQDWTNLGGNAERNGLSTGIGPTQSVLHWTKPDSNNFISWHPHIVGDRVFAIRQSGSPVHGGSSNDVLVCYDLETGSKLWDTVPVWSGDTQREGTAFILLVSGFVYVSRSSVGKPGPIHAYSRTDGSRVWTSSVSTETGAYDGAVALGAGILVGDHRNVYFIGSAGHEIWRYPRSCGVSGRCGPSYHVSSSSPFGAIFTRDFTAGGYAVTKLDSSGRKLYTSSAIPEQVVSSPVLHPFGTLVLVQGLDNLYAVHDNGTQMGVAWSVPTRRSFGAGFTVGNDGSIYAFSPLGELMKIRFGNGTIQASTAPLSPLPSVGFSPQLAFGANDVVYVSNGDSSGTSNNGRLWAFSGDLTQSHFTLTTDRPNIGGPALGRKGTLVVSDVDGIRAYRVSCGAFSVRVEGAGGTPPAAGGLNFAIVNCATSNGSVLIAASANPNGFTPTSTCGLNWSMAKAKEFATTANLVGEAMISTVAPLRLLGRQVPVQALDVSTCTLSSVHLAQF